MVWIFFLILFLVVVGLLVFNAIALTFMSAGGFLRAIFGGKKKRKSQPPPPSKKYSHGAEEAEYEVIE